MKELTFGEAAALKAEIEATEQGANAIYAIIAAAYKKGYEAAKAEQEEMKARG